MLAFFDKEIWLDYIVPRVHDSTTAWISFFPPLCYERYLIRNLVRMRRVCSQSGSGVVGD